MALKRCQNVTIFSDGSLLFDFLVTNKNFKIINTKNNDLKNFQKISNKNLLKNRSNISQDSSFSIFRKRLFK